MKIGFVVNDIASELPTYTTTGLGWAALARGHEVWVMGTGDFVHDAAGRVEVHARSAPARPYAAPADYLDALRGPEAARQRIVAEDLDVVMLRNDPAQDAKDRSWAQTTPLLFAQICKERGVITLNDPHALASALNKIYLEQFPAIVRPRTLISRHPEDLREFIELLGGQAVLKPLQGSGGASVFLVAHDRKNVNQMIQAVSRDGYVVCQEYLPGAARGDLRVFLMNGQPLEVEGRCAAFRRVSTNGDFRSNISAGGRLEAAEIPTSVRELVELVRPKLIRDGMFLVGLDVADDKLMEVNVFSPGGLYVAEREYGVPFCRAVIEAVERKVGLRSHYAKTIENVEFAIL